DSGSNELIVKIVDSETDEVIRQIPQEELLELSKHLEELHGNLVDTVS
ncbi:MAG: flagellar protein FlaG, partial [Desulfobulbus sp.]|nr:flagellar protein FlaG [Desulfobulbus sp.]